MLAFLTSFDLFGRPIEVTYKGDGAFKTRLGTFMTLAFYVLATINFVNLCI